MKKKGNALAIVIAPKKMKAKKPKKGKKPTSSIEDFMRKRGSKKF